MDILLEQLEKKIENLIKKNSDYKKQLILVSEEKEALEKANKDLQNSIKEYEAKVFAVMQSLDSVEQNSSKDKKNEDTNQSDTANLETKSSVNQQQQMEQELKTEKQQNYSQESNTEEADNDIEFGSFENNNKPIDLSK